MASAHSDVTTIHVGGAAAPPVARRRKVRLAPYLLILPAIIMLLLAMGYPLGWQIWASFMKFGLKQQFGAPPDFVGLANYVTIFTDSTVWGVVGRSLLFCIVNAVLTVVIGVALALLMNAVNKAIRLILQIALLLAWAMPVVAAMTVWIWLFDWRRGVINYVLTSMGFNFSNYVWLGTAMGLYFVATVVVVWMSVPFVAFSIYAGLTQVSEEVMEAASLDGATSFKRFTSIIVPMIRPVLMIVALLQIIWDLRVFTQIRMLQDSQMPLDSDLLGTYIYRLGVSSGDFSMASALSIFVLILTIVFSIAYVLQLVKEDS
ncbi:MAG: sugar ABC transporter permease [Propionibacteriaceae bacterium]|jgi:N,N'-diacetylchitobiose transport system permease protein|nr:sugar ABC transporter permease [Propionibacteriaceae bacterium]